MISIHLPLTNDSFHFANAEFFSALKRKPYLVNTSRGATVNTAELVDALQSGKIAGAALDVLENENLDRFTKQDRTWFDFLKNHPNVLITPHIAGYSVEASCKMSAILLQKLAL